ncbi:MAG: heat-inducible transcriptional repressor HrcA [Candidatus Dormibacteria bacterium]
MPTRSGRRHEWAGRSTLIVDSALPLDERKKQILKAVVFDYTETAVPVGSHALAAHLSSWSSATIRNELANLVDIGYLLQPHTSAGRVPSDLGYRYYVDFLMEEEELPAGVRRQMQPYLGELPLALEELLEVAAMVLAIATDAVSLVTGPRSLRTALKHVDVVSLDGSHALLILVTEGNLVRHQSISLSREATQSELSEVAGRLNARLPTLGEPSDAGAVESQTPLRQEIADHIVAFMKGVDSRQDALVVHDGVRNLLHQPEFGDPGRLQQVLDVVEEERILGDVLASLDVDQGIHVMIGRESGIEQLDQCSLVLTTYRAGGGRIGTVGVLGPTRMRYSQVAPRVRYVSQRIGSGLNRILN